MKHRAESGPCIKFTRGYSSSLDELLYYVVQMYETGYSGDLNSKL